MIKNGWAKKNKRKRLRTLIIYPARKNSEKRYKRENVMTSISNKKSLPGTFAKVCVWQFGQTLKKRWERSARLDVGNVPGRVRLSSRSTSYICRYFADRQLFSLAINTFIYWIFNVMFNSVHHHCHPFTDFYKRFTCVEPRPFFTVRKSDTLILWRACLLVVPAGLNPRTYSIGTLQNYFWFRWETTVNLWRSITRTNHW